MMTYKSFKFVNSEIYLCFEDFCFLFSIQGISLLDLIKVFEFVWNGTKREQFFIIISCGSVKKESAWSVDHTN